MLDTALAEIYGVPTKALVQAVKRNLARFPADFMFRLMLSSVLRSDRVVQVNIAIMRTFVRLCRLLASHPDLARKLDALELTPA